MAGQTEMGGQQMVAERPKVSPGDWITIGEKGLMEAVVCGLFEDSASGKEFIQCIYLDGSDRVIYGEMEWRQTGWGFAGRPGDYADNIEGLSDYVHILRAGR